MVKGPRGEVAVAMSAQAERKPQRLLQYCMTYTPVCGLRLTTGIQLFTTLFSSCLAWGRISSETKVHVTRSVEVYGVEGKGVGVVAAWRRALCAVLEAVFVGGAVHVERVRCCV